MRKMPAAKVWCKESTQHLPWRHDKKKTIMINRHKASIHAANKGQGPHVRSRSTNLSTAALNLPHVYRGARIAQSVQWAAMGWTVRGSNPGGGEIFRTCPDQPWGPPGLLYNGYWVFPGVKWPRHGTDHPPASCAEVKERVEPYLYFPLGPSWLVLGWTLPVPWPHSHISTYALLDVLQQERWGSQVVHRTVKETLDLLLVQIHRNDMCQTWLAHHLCQQLAHNTATFPHLACTEQKFHTYTILNTNLLHNVQY